MLILTHYRQWDLEDMLDDIYRRCCLEAEAGPQVKGVAPDGGRRTKEKKAKEPDKTATSDLSRKGKEELAAMFMAMDREETLAVLKPLKKADLLALVRKVGLKANSGNNMNYMKDLLVNHFAYIRMHQKKY